MAVDTRDKRFSMMGLAQPVPSVYANPDGAIGTADRAQLVFLYSGISLDGLPEPSGVAPGVKFRGFIVNVGRLGMR